MKKVVWEGWSSFPLDKFFWWYENKRWKDIHLELDAFVTKEKTEETERKVRITVEEAKE